MIDPHIEQALKVKEGYVRANFNTIEVVAYRDPKTRAVFYKKVQIDENAVKFAEGLRNQPVKLKAQSHSKKPIITRATVEKKPRRHTPTRPNSVRSKIFKDFESGLTKKELAEKYDLSVRRVTAEICKRKTTLNITRNNYGKTYLQLVPHFEKGKRNVDLARDFGLASHTVCYHRKKWRESLVK